MNIAGIPAVLYGEPSSKVYLFVHGKCGCKEEAEAFSRVVCPMGWQVLGIDLPEHGERRGQAPALEPWNAIPELQTVMQYLRTRWQRIALRANSIGAWLCMQSFGGMQLDHCLFVSPILDMQQLIGNIMQWAGVDEAELFEKKVIPTQLGEPLSWRYLEFAREHPITQWDPPTSILYAGQDQLTSHATVSAFSERFGCQLSVSEQSEHWFHTPEQLAVLEKFEREACRRQDA